MKCTAAVLLTVRVPLRDACAPQVIGNKWDTYLDLITAEYSEG